MDRRSALKAGGLAAIGASLSPRNADAAVSAHNWDRYKVDVGGSLDPGYPLPGKVRQARFVLPSGADWKGLKLRAELEVKGGRHPVRRACQQRLNDDGSLGLRPTAGLGSVI